MKQLFMLAAIGVALAGCASYGPAPGYAYGYGPGSYYGSGAGVYGGTASSPAYPGPNFTERTASPW